MNCRTLSQNPSTGRSSQYYQEKKKKATISGVVGSSQNKLTRNLGPSFRILTRKAEHNLGLRSRNADSRLTFE